MPMCDMMDTEREAEMNAGKGGKMNGLSDASANIILAEEIITEEDHLDEVMAKMRLAGSPVVIRATWAAYLDSWVALEGSYRITAASILGRVIYIDEIPYDDTRLLDLGIDDGGYGTFTVADYVDSAYERQQVEVGLKSVMQQPREAK